MGLGDAGLLEDGDGGGGGKAVTAAAVSCSICFDAVLENGDRSWAKLQCGHQFHLDCIGSAFNVKGAMQCPNCRKIEKGQWLYASGNRSLPDFSMDDWAHDDDLFDLSYYEMSFGGVHWCPFNGLTRLPSSLEEGELQSTPYHDLLGHHALFTEHTHASSATHPCPYIAYARPIHPSSSASNGNVSDGSIFNNHWTGPIQVPSSYILPMDVHYHNRDHSSPYAASNWMASADPSVTQRTARSSLDIPRPGMHSSVVGHGVLNSVTSQVHPHFPDARPRDRPPSVQAYFQQSGGGPVARTSLISMGRRSSNHRGGLAQVAPRAESSSDQPTGFYFFTSSSSGRTFQESENHRNRYHNWEREPQLPFPLVLTQAERDSIWATFHQSAMARQRHGSERMPSHNRS